MKPGQPSTHAMCAYQLPNLRLLYVSDLPGHGGKDWGYTHDASKALPLTPYWIRRFRADRAYCGQHAIINYCEVRV